MKLRKIALATAFALLSTAALAQPQPGTTYGQSVTSVGTVTAPSAGSYTWPSVGTTNAVPTWSNTGPSAPAPGAPTIGTAPFSSGARR
jgi:hypothetical protein